MTAEERMVLKEKIVAAITKTEQEIVSFEEITQPITPENSIGRISRMDAINNKSVAEVALRQAKRKLANLNVALSKIDSPEFGMCSRCGQAIAPMRLMFMPQSTNCVHCAE